MREALLPRTAVASGAVLAVAGLAAAFFGSLEMAVALPVGLCAAGLVVRFPFVGLWLIHFLTQLDAIAHMIFQALPVSGVKILTLLTLAGVVFNASRKTAKIGPGPADLGLRMAILFGITLLISFLFASSIPLALWSIRRLLSLILLVYLTIRLTKDVRRVELLALAIVTSTLVSGVIVLLDWAIGGHLVASDPAATTASWQSISRSSGASDYNPTTSATMLLAGTTLALVLGLRTPRWRLLTLSTSAIGTLALIFTFARSAAIVFGVMLVWLLFKFRRSRRLPALLAVAVMTVVCILPFIPSEYWDRLGTLTDFNTDRTLWRRLGYHIIGFDLLAQNPLVGIGPGNFREYYTHLEYRWLPGHTIFPRHLHNMYLEVATETGLLGFACFGGLLLVALRSLARVRRRPRTADLSVLAESVQFSFVAFLLASAFLPNEYNKYTWLLVGLALVLGQVNSGEERRDLSRRGG